MNAVEGNSMKDCCTVDNIDQATGDGKLSCKINVLVCRTCGWQGTYMYRTTDEMNACWSYVLLGVERQKALMEVFAK